jgi:uncharacterized protein
MSILDHFSLPYQGMKDGSYEYHFDVDDAFFAAFESSPISRGNLGVNLIVDKRPNLSVMKFDILGYINAPCDRCLADIKLPLKANFQLLVKVGDSENNEDDVIYFSPDQPALKLAVPIYEMIVLSMPISNVYGCEKEALPPCNNDILEKLKDQQEIQDDPSEDNGSSIWDSLKKHRFELD